ncbi:MULTISPECIES: transglycosylase SLT domain-containing protein [Pseudomonas syringae group]|uniref:Soluble lytic murein transglycosylase n=1 Tax=Pseudomonas syringae pv. ribicola TaxID=55398 RepID=A0A0P9YFE9_PSESI|nr:MULTISPECIES: transglycosylase SLT domain-containing protein [Pseudomonas syringae group]EKN45810.1 soluble lytic murein transglycosylase [Pseudomonas viridiflava UASWS0038]KPL65919.1 lytic transglycosylase [Pseudomonas viridiflava]KPY42550.1 Soluble lytic murein transglycosylase [Pseudomonas syringae pv. ribicola]KPZ27595.1 Soluble lytic murein transglycosylase [Pseudomonas viridiflava]OAG84424.1 lytic transglycosylase [Pseudomonas viridiflava]
MRSRLFSFLSCLLLSATTVQTAHAADLTQQRKYYDEAKRALAKGDLGPYQMYSAVLADYPLEPYLEYDELTARLKTASNAEIEKFLAEHGDLPQANWMKLRWLRWLAERGDWQPFVKYYDPKMNFVELDCLYGQYQLNNNKRAEGYASAEKLWMTGKTLPAACDAFFAQWAAAGQLTEQKRWQRAKLAAQSRNYTLANTLVNSLNSLAPQGKLLVAVAQKPEMINNPGQFVPVDEAMSDVVGLGLRRLARQDPQKALAMLDSYAITMHFSREEQVEIAKEIGLTLARRYDDRALEVMTKYDPDLRDNTVTEWRMRLLLRLGRWEDAYELARRLPKDLASTNRWRYWEARALELAQPNSPLIPALYKDVAKERDFYGFLAADRIQSPYQLNNKPLVLSQALINKVRNTPGVRRALEFHDRGEIVDGRREWYHVSRHFNRDEMVAQAKLAYDLKWYFPAIRTISQAQYWDDLDIRFPMAHRDTLVREAKIRGLHSSWVFAITRQESAFMDDARSGVGASGLMQLMPATAKETARKYSIPLASPQQVLDPDTNIQLGAAYLSSVHSQFNGNRVLASAAYNAGPGRVRQWLKGANHLAFDVWVESIPFDETRQYVQNVLSYSVIYGQKLNSPQPLVDWHERFFDDL